MFLSTLFSFSVLAVSFTQEQVLVQQISVKKQLIKGDSESHESENANLIY